MTNPVPPLFTASASRVSAGGILNGDGKDILVCVLFGWLGFILRTVL